MGSIPPHRENVAWPKKKMARTLITSHHVKPGGKKNCQIFSAQSIIGKKKLPSWGNPGDPRVGLDPPPNQQGEDSPLLYHPGPCSSSDTLAPGEMSAPTTARMLARRHFGRSPPLWPGKRQGRGRGQGRGQWWRGGGPFRGETEGLGSQARYRGNGVFRN